MSELQRLFDAIFGTPSVATAPTEKLVEGALHERAARHPELKWRTSIVDLMKLVGLDPTLEARVHMAKQLGYRGPFDGSEEMNTFLHQKVLEHIGVPFR